jgi:hypothetical protein
MINDRVAEVMHSFFQLAVLRAADKNFTWFSEKSLQYLLNYQLKMVPRAGCFLHHDYMSFILGM